MIQFEGLYNGNKTGINTNEISLNQLNNSVLSPMNPFLSEVSIFGSVSYPFTPLFTGSLSCIYNPKYELYFIIPQLT